jgi:hypothetical protein
VVVFTDLNDFVLIDATLSNVVLNTTELVSPEQLSRYVQLGAGDWLDMSRLLLQNDSDYGAGKNLHLPVDGKFDLILAAETLYSEEACSDTAKLMARHLKPETGVGYVATKRYYFGVGGGVDSFLHCAGALDSQLAIDRVQVYDSGSGNIREVLKVQRKGP